MHVQRKNANNGPAPVQKLDRRRSDPVLDRPGPEPVTEPVRPLENCVVVILPEGGVRSIVISMSVCLCVCLYVCMRCLSTCVF